MRRDTNAGENRKTNRRLVQSERPDRFSDIAVALISLRRNDRAKVFRDNFGRRKFAKIDIISDPRYESRRQQQHRPKRSIEPGIQQRCIDVGKKVARTRHRCRGIFVSLRIRKLRGRTAAAALNRLFHRDRIETGDQDPARQSNCRSDCDQAGR